MRKFTPLFFSPSHYPVMNSHVYGGLPPTDYFCTGQPPVVDNPNLKSRSEMGWQAAVGGVWWCLVKRSPDTMEKNMAGRKVYIPIVFGVQNHMFQVFLAHYSAFNFEVCDWKRQHVKVIRPIQKKNVRKTKLPLIKLSKETFAGSNLQIFILVETVVPAEGMQPGCLCAANTSSNASVRIPGLSPKRAENMIPVMRWIQAAQDLAGFEPAATCFQHHFKIPGNLGWRGGGEVLESRLPLPLMKQR